MIQLNIVSKYVKAINDLAIQNEAGTKYLEDLEYILKEISDNPELKYCLSSLTISKNIRTNIANEIFHNKVDQVVLNLFNRLLLNNRIEYLDAIYLEFEKLVLKTNNILKLTVVSAYSLDEDILQKLKEKYQSIYNVKDIYITELIDKTLLGGLKIIIGDTVIDDTIKNKLNQLNRILGV